MNANRRNNKRANMAASIRALNMGNIMYGNAGVPEPIIPSFPSTPAESRRGSFAENQRASANRSGSTVSYTTGSRPSSITFESPPLSTATAVPKQANFFALPVGTFKAAAPVAAKFNPHSIPHLARLKELASVPMNTNAASYANVTPEEIEAARAYVPPHNSAFGAAASGRPPLGRSSGSRALIKTRKQRKAHRRASRKASRRTNKTNKK
jgi:hypothetical protein